MKRLIIAASIVLTGCQMAPTVVTVPKAEFDRAVAMQAEAKQRSSVEYTLRQLRSQYDQDAAMTDVNVGCYKVWLLQTQAGATSEACPEGELQAFTGSMNVQKDKRASYAACYTKKNGKATIRWLDGSPKGMGAVTTVAIPLPGTPSRPVPSSCTAPVDPYRQVIIVRSR